MSVFGPRTATRTTALLLFFSVLVLFLVTNYGGIRSPDSEIVFRVGESLASLGGFHVEELTWRGHGVVEGRDGKLYSVYGPVESLILAPVIALARAANETGWYESEGRRVPFSHFSGSGLTDYINGIEHSDPEPHAVRYLASLVNPLIGAIITLQLFLLLTVMTRSTAAALAVSVLHAVGTLHWHYSGTFFSEQPATLLLLLSFHLLITRDPRFGAESGEPSRARLLGAAAFLTLAFATHVTAVLFAPFIVAYALWLCLRAGMGKLRTALHSVWLLAGFGIALLPWGLYNILRFGAFFETGRTVGAEEIEIYGWGSLRAPWQGLYNLLFSSGKGLILFCPAVLIGVVGWIALHRRHRALSLILAAIVLSRLLIIGSLGIWHGGFSLGPRYLVMLLPFLLLPAGFWLKEKLAANSLRAFVSFAVFAIACSIQQLYFVLADIFSFSHVIKWSFEDAGIDVFAKDLLYLEWKLTPLWNLHRAPRAPYLLQGIELSNLTLWTLGSVLLASGLAALFFLVWRTRHRTHE